MYFSIKLCKNKILIILIFLNISSIFIMQSFENPIILRIPRELLPLKVTIHITERHKNQ
jgi:hypothetical protein